MILVLRWVVIVIVILSSIWELYICHELFLSRGLISKTLLSSFGRHLTLSSNTLEDFQLNVSGTCKHIKPPPLQNKETQARPCVSAILDYTNLVSGRSRY